MWPHGVSPKEALVFDLRDLLEGHMLCNWTTNAMLHPNLVLGIWSLTGSLSRIFLQELVSFLSSVPTFLSPCPPGGLPAGVYLTALSLSQFPLLSCLLLQLHVFLFILCI